MVRKLMEIIVADDPIMLQLEQYLARQELQGEEKYRQILAQLPGPEEEKSLAALYPNLATEWCLDRNYPLRPNMFSPKSGLKVWWGCSKGHIWEAIISSRTRQNANGNGCKMCWVDGLSMFTAKGGSLGESHPQLLQEWDYEKNVTLDPYRLAAKSGMSVWWKCRNGHSWEGKISQRVAAKYGCMTCSREERGKTSVVERSLAFQFPSVALQWNVEKNLPMTPQNTWANSGKKVWWKCNEGHESYVSVSNRVHSKVSCKICEAAEIQKRAQGTRILKTGCLTHTHPEVLAFWDAKGNNDISTDLVTFGSQKMASWICSNGHHFTAAIRDVVKSFEKSGLQGCKYCAGKATYQSVRPKDG
jgi:hypothetical protein